MNCPHWLLALTIPFSRSDRAHTCLRPVLVPGVPKDCSGRNSFAGESPSDAGGPGQAVPTGRLRYQTRLTNVNAPEQARFSRIAARANVRTQGSGSPGGPRGWFRGHSGARRPEGDPRHGWRRGQRPPACHGHTVRWHAAGHPALRMPPGAGSSTGSPPHPSPSGPPKGLLSLLTSSIYRAHKLTTCVPK
jgi:hypothetical protein